MSGLVAWFTGRSGAGKSTLADLARDELTRQGRRVQVLDGDVLRRTLHRHLGFTVPDIVENNRRIALLCQTERDAYDVILVPIISPFRASRQAARQLLAPAFLEVYVQATLDTVQQRDPKGHYAKIKQGKLKGFIGVDGPAYEPPEQPDVVLDTEHETPAACAARLVAAIQAKLTECIP